MDNNRLKKGDGVPFVQISNDILYDRELSLKAKGLYSFMLSKPNNWNFTTRSMASQLKESRPTIMSVIGELKNFGLLSYTHLPHGKGEYTIYTSVKKLDHGKQMHRKRNASEKKLDRISNKYPSNNKEFFSNPDIRDFRKAIISTKHTGRLDTVFVEHKQEDVFLDAEGYLYTSSKTSKQLVQSTINEIWTQLFDINEMKKRAKPERAMA